MIGARKASTNGPMERIRGAGFDPMDKSLCELPVLWHR
jgi:hypothetical protein